MDDPSITTGPGERPARRRVRLRVAYDGTEFHGFAPNAGVRTVAGELNRAMSTIVREPVELTGAGRTDAGVHGWGQVVHVDVPPGTDVEGLVRRVNKMCAPDISIREPLWVDDDFDARFSATWREYRYHVWNDPAPNPLVARSAWHVPRPMSLWALQAAGDPFIGEHDFASFCRRPDPGPGRPPPSLVRRVFHVRWSHPGETPMLRLEIRATAFCQQMVRSIVGTMVDVGLGRLSPGDVNAILRARDRAVAGAVAPPHGLVLWDVGYDGERWDHDRRGHDWLPRG